MSTALRCSTLPYNALCCAKLHLGALDHPDKLCYGLYVAAAILLQLLYLLSIDAVAIKPCI